MKFEYKQAKKLAFSFIQFCFCNTYAKLPAVY